jgi:four helix bundle protein
MDQRVDKVKARGSGARGAKDANGLEHEHQHGNERVHDDEHADEHENESAESARSRPRMEVVMTVPAVAPEMPVLDLDRLDVYRVAVQFCAIASRLRVSPAALRDQIDRASASVVLTLAEGVGRVSGPDRAHFFAMARGSAFECAAVLDLLKARGALPPASHAESRRLLVRIVQMLTRRIERQRHPQAKAADAARHSQPRA